jgi:hypothetical protein
MSDPYTTQEPASRQAGGEQCLLVIVAAPALEEPLVDWLLAREDCPGFSSQASAGHSRRHQDLSLAEQVAGRRRQVMFHVHLDREAARALIADLREAFAGAGLHYWLLPVLAAGSLAEAQA